MTVSIFFHQDKPLQPGHIMVGVEEYAVRDLPVSSRSARLLVVTLHRLREGGVDHKAHVRFVNAHSKGNCRTDNLTAILINPLVLYFISGGVTEASVISQGSKAIVL